MKTIIAFSTCLKPIYEMIEDEINVVFRFVPLSKKKVLVIIGRLLSSKIGLPHREL